MDGEEVKHRPHRANRAGRSHEKKKTKLKSNGDGPAKLDQSREAAKKRNPRAFTVNSAVTMRRTFNRSQDHKNLKQYIPVVNKDPVEPPPIIVAIVGPPKVGKSTLMKSLIKHYTMQKMSSVDGPITVVSGKYRRITLLECPCDLNSMIDVAKVADLVLVMVDASYGFEMEIFEFIHIAQVHGLPRIMAVVTHLDCIPAGDKANKVKKKLKHRFWTELYDGATVFSLSRLAKEDEYMSQEISNLARFISVIKFRPILWKQNHSYVLCDRMEDLTDPGKKAVEPKCDRDVVFYGYIRGANMKAKSQVHIPGVGDFSPKNVNTLPDPCPLPTKIKKRSLNKKEKIIYAPLTGYGGLLYDMDAVYLDTELYQGKEQEGDELLHKLRNSNHLMETAEQRVTLLTGGNDIRERRPVPENLNDNPRQEEYGAGTESDEDLDTSYVDVIEMEIDRNGENNSQIDEVLPVTENEDLSGSEDENKELLLEIKSTTPDMEQFSYEGLWQIVYGNPSEELGKKSINQSNVGGLFVKIMERTTNLDSRDETIPYKRKFMTNTENVCMRIEKLKAELNCLVTGDWGNEDAAKLLEEDDEVDEDDFDFEDLEQDSKDDDNEEVKATDKTETQEEDKTAKQKAYEKKRALKEVFNREYDDKGDPTSGFFEEWKKETEDISNRNKQEFSDLPDDVRIEFEGFRSGLYLRIEMEGVPCELIDNFNPKHPLIIGGLLPNEQKRSTLHLRVKRHRWFTRPVLKSRDPLIYSLGWRRFQSMPLYYMQDHNMRQRFLKYSPENMHCWAVMKAPVISQGSGFLAIQSMNQKCSGFRIAATGTVLHQDHNTKVVKKLKLVGYPMKIFKNTAFVKDMFTSQIEAAKFEDAQVRTVSGIRGIIKKSLKTPEGAVRISFEDRILATDIIFCRTWAALSVPDFYLPVTNLLQSKDNKLEWKGMKTIGEIRNEKGIAPDVNASSLYKPIERKKRVFNKFEIPKSLQKELPFKSKPKEEHTRVAGINKKTALGVRTSVLREPKERKIAALLNLLAHTNNEKLAKRKEKSNIRAAIYKKKLLAEEKARKERKKH